MMAYTLVEGKAFAAPQWRFGRGLRECYQSLPGDMAWQALHGSQRYVAAVFSVGASALHVDELRLWVRRSGSPGTLTAEIWSDDGSGKPEMVLNAGSDNVDTNTIKDTLSVFHGFSFPQLGDLSAEVKYHVVVYGASSDQAANHWEVGVDVNGSTAKRSADGLLWAGGMFGLYFRVAGVNPNRRFRFFEMEGSLYALDARADGSPSKIFMNGERGRATSGGTKSLTDTDRGIKGTWDEDEWNGWQIHILHGKGHGQRRTIADSTSSGQLTVERDWEIPPDGSSQYVIYGGEGWQDITPSSGNLIDDVIRDVVVFNRYATFAMGANYPALFFRYNGEASPPRHETLDAPTDTRTMVDLLHVANDPVDGPQLWLGRNTDMTVTRMGTFDWASPASAGDISRPISVGDDNYPITTIADFNGHVYVFKPDGMYSIANDRANKLNIGLGFILSENNGQALTTHNSYQYFSWGGFSLQRLVGREISSVGPDQGTGLPENRRGAVVELASHPIGLFACIDGGEDNFSSVMLFNEKRGAWHEIFRGWEAGKRVRSIHWQVNAGRQPRMWIDAGGELVYQDWPQDASNPLCDKGMKYQHESALEFSGMDMGAARLPKFFKELTLVSDHLDGQAEVHLEYQLDGQIGSEVWTAAGKFVRSPEDTLAIQRGDSKRIRYRLRMLTEDASKPPVLRALVLEAFARTPLKYQWKLRVKVGDGQVNLAGGRDHDPDAFSKWLKRAARQAKRIHMRSQWEELDDIYVIIEPPTLLRTFSNRLLGFWGGIQTLTIREA